jgi:hypothetical protein
MRCGYSASTPASRLVEECQLQSFLAWFDAAQVGPIQFCQNPREY